MSKQPLELYVDTEKLAKKVDSFEEPTSEIQQLKAKYSHPENTHYCCNKRLKEEGGKARCCVCVPHEDCEINKSKIQQLKAKIQ